MTARLRTLFVLPDLSFGGSERVMLTVLAGLDRTRFEPALAVGRRGGHFADQVPQDVPLFELGARRARGMVLPLAGLVRRERPAVVFSSLGYVNMLVMLARPLMPGPTAFVGRETNIPSRNLARSRFPRLLPALYRRLYPRFDAVVCQSGDMREDMVRGFGLPGAKARVINNPVDVARVAALAEQDDPLGLVESMPGRIRLVAAGKLKAQKGFDLLLDAMARLPRDLAPDVGLTILGEGPDRAVLEARAASLGLAERVLFAGFAANPFPAMAAADAFVLSSRFEGFPNVVLEAMACGTPVAAFACPGGLNEIVQPGVNGLLAEPGDPGALAGAIVSLVREPPGGEAVADSVASRFGARKIISQYEDLLLEVAR